MINFKQFFNIILEGGNVFKQYPTQRINLPDVEPTINFLSGVVGINLMRNLLGSTGKRESSGDLDIAIDENKISKVQLYDILANWCIERNLNPKDYIARSGISVHFRTPVVNRDSEYVQTDFMFVPNVKFAQFVLANDEVPPYKGMHRAVVLSNLAKNINLRWSGIKGITSRDTGSVIEDYNTDRIAQILLGDANARTKNLVTIKNILTFLLKKYKDINIVRSLLSEAAQTISKDGLDIYNLLQNDVIKESVDQEGQRVGVQHLYSQYKPESYSMSFENFIKLLDALESTGGIIQPGNSSISEKADGLSVKFGITRDDKFFLQGSYSGPVTDGNFKNKITYEPVRKAFEDNFNKIKKLVYKSLLRYKKDLKIDGLRVQAEWLYSPFALSRENKPGIVYFVGTNYEQDKLGTWSTFPIINITDYNGSELKPDLVNDITKTLTDLTNNEVKFIPLNIDVFEPINLSYETGSSIQEIKAFEMQNPNYEEVLYSTSRKREDQQAKKAMRAHLVNILLPYQKRMHAKILRKLGKLAGKLGDYEGIVIKIQQSDNKPFTFKVISPTFHKNKGRI
jgi:hypothetical protein